MVDADPFVLLLVLFMELRDRSMKAEKCVGKRIGQ